MSAPPPAADGRPAVISDIAPGAPGVTPDRRRPRASAGGGPTLAGMYVAAHFAMSPDEVATFLAEPGAGDLVTVHDGGPVATYLPWLFDPSAGEHGALRSHVARNNRQWDTPCRSESLVILHGPDHYVSPGSLPSKDAGGRVVPTWNYVTLHVYGRLVAHDDPAWCRDVVTALTDLHESRREHPWRVQDAPAEYTESMLRAIVGLELEVTRIEAKAKMAQNKTPADVAALVAEREAAGDETGAAFLRDVSLPAAHARAATLDRLRATRRG